MNTSDRSPNSLPYFSRQAAKHLASARPEWAAIAEIVKEQDGQDFLLVRIPAPSSNNLINPWASEYSACVWLSTAGEKMTVGLDRAHIHFYNTPKTALKNAIGLIDQLIRELHVVVNHFDENDDLSWSVISSLDEAPSSRFRSTRRTEIKSFSGRLDQQINHGAH